MTESVQIYDFSNLNRPKPTMKVQALIEEAESEGPIKVIMPMDSGPRLNELLKKLGWHLEEEDVQGNNWHITLMKD